MRNDSAVEQPHPLGVPREYNAIKPATTVSLSAGQLWVFGITAPAGSLCRMYVSEQVYADGRFFQSTADGWMTWEQRGVLFQVLASR